MTTVRDRPRADAGARRRAERPKPSRTARMRVAVRIARRQVRRAWVSSLLIMSLIALPIAGMAGVAVFISSTFSTPAERVNVELGRMSAWVEPMWPAASGFRQMPDDPYTHGNESTWGSETIDDETAELPTDPTNALPAGTEIVPVSSGEERVETIAGIARVKAWAGDVTDPRFDGHFALVEGRAPADDRQVLVTPATLTRTGLGLGGTLSLVDGQKFTITGTFRDAEVAADEVVLAFADSDRYAPVRSYMPDADIGLSQLEALNAAGFGVYSRQLVLDPPPVTSPVGDDFGNPTTAERDQQQAFALAGAIGAGGLAAGYMVVLLAGAAFAVSARRQQRALAIAASVGAEPRDLRRVVLLQGAVLGLVAGGAGLAMGVGLAAALMPLFDDGSAVRFWGFHVPWVLLGGVLLFAVAVGSASAWAPARAVGKSDTISALRGARRPMTVTAARPLWGSLLIVVGVAVTVVSGIAAGAVAASTIIAWDSPLRWIPIVGIIGGPVLAQIGIIISGRWLLWLASRALSRVGLAARLASRDAVANGARTVPAFAAIGATVFVGVFAVSMGTMTAEQQARTYTYSAPLGTVVADISSMSEPLLTAKVGQQAANEAARLFTSSGATSTALVSAQPDILNVGSSADLLADLDRAMIVAPRDSLLPPGEDDGRVSSYLGYPSDNLSIVAADDVEAAMRVTLDPAQRAAYADGAVIISDDRYVTDGRVTAGSWSAREYYEGEVPSNIWRDDADVPAPRWERTAPAISVDAPHQQIVAAIAPETARAWGITEVPRQVLATFPEGSEMNSQDHLYELAGGLMTADYQVSLWRETGPSSPDVWLVPLLAAVAVLVLGASAVALGLARFERRPDDATLAAVGGTPGLRRRIGLWQGLVIAGFGTFAGATAGILPPTGFWLQSQTSHEPMSLADIPWWLLAVLAVALPVGIAAVNWLVPPREPELTRRNVIA
ncbi:FtsX-like permease family protein [Microbacterium sp. 11MF]|uniref:FtsX-like permease family protein n=1 Tax=Microbacterium sp. 11MF TaxID=1169146 RepID=UPI0003776F1E|nr:FtsX-like permease family protein [Microbacterium sp. 11MF]